MTERKLIGPEHTHQLGPCTDACCEPAVPEPQQAVTDAQYADEFRRIAESEARVLAGELRPADASLLLDLVRKACLREFEAGLRQGQGNIVEAQRLSREADNLRARVVALVPQQLVQAQRAERHALNRPLTEAFDTLRDEAELAKEFGPQFGAFLARERTPEVLPTDAELDIQIGEVTRERDEARAEVERLKSERPDPMVLRLPEVPEGTVALTGNRTGRRYTWDADDGWLCGIIGGSLGEVLTGEGPEGVRVELAPPREPRTAAEIWMDATDAERECVTAVNPMLAELAEALDREAGL